MVAVDAAIDGAVGVAALGVLVLVHSNGYEAMAAFGIGAAVFVADAARAKRQRGRVAVPEFSVGGLGVQGRRRGHQAGTARRYAAYSSP